MLARRLALAIALVAAFVGSQGPEFAQQYRQRLGGALDEVRRSVVQFDAEAVSQGLTPAEGVRRLEASGDFWCKSAARTWRRRWRAPTVSRRN